MAGPLRIEYPGAYYHVINRGNARENIFPRKEDKEKFLGYLARAVEQFAINVHTYCLMSNHYHLIIETPKGNLSSAIQWLNVSYAISYNRRQKRRGHLFGGRFKALLIEAEEYLTHLSRYIHLNPIRAKMVRRPQDYLWSSYPGLIGRAKRPDWLVTRELLSYFAPRVSSYERGKQSEAIRQYREYVEEVDVERVENPNKQAIGGFVLGGTDFVKWIQETFLAARRNEKEIPQIKELRPRISLERVLQAVCKEFDCGGLWSRARPGKRS